MMKQCYLGLECMSTLNKSFLQIQYNGDLFFSVFCFYSSGWYLEWYSVHCELSSNKPDADHDILNRKHVILYSNKSNSQKGIQTNYKYRRAVCLAFCFLFQTLLTNLSGLRSSQLNSNKIITPKNKNSLLFWRYFQNPFFFLKDLTICIKKKSQFAAW